MKKHNLRITPEELNHMIRAVHRSLTVFSHETADEYSIILNYLEHQQEKCGPVLEMGVPIFISLDRRQIYLISTAVLDAADNAQSEETVRGLETNHYTNLYSVLAQVWGHNWLVGNSEFGEFIDSDEMPDEVIRYITLYEKGKLLKLSAFVVSKLIENFDKAKEYVDVLGRNDVCPIDGIIRAYEDLAFADPPEVKYFDDQGIEHVLQWNKGDESVGIQPGYEEVERVLRDKTLPDLKDRRDSLRFALTQIEALIKEHEDNDG